MRALRIVARLVGAVVAIVFAVWLGCFVAVLLAARRDQAATMERPAVAIIVMGAAQYDGRPSPVLRARLDHALTLWRHGLARRMIFTGGRGTSPGGIDWTSEAAVGRRYAVAHGVPDSAILMESEGRTTDQSLRAAAALLREIVRQDSVRRDSVRAAGGDGAAPTPAEREAAILVSDPFHMLRLSVVARRYGIEPYTSPTPTSPISSNQRLTWRYMLGESLKVPFVFFVEKSPGD
ncbi:protein of unknown function DUF218 [Gemmatirosa kalamazoonensis]|uniref:DUF218 domain-containing protein n=1 Tax=Gemmatirosa kalamazoonensis TaxID=861299 RepID=W0RCE6_9BACT|nr:YdcF family protein [Gemmatirosa kalamazoonensis]AHG88466.1 protein of unknown function DUF218 [Gemmatirosa kalamazoonensis]